MTAPSFHISFYLLSLTLLVGLIRWKSLKFPAHLILLMLFLDFLLDSTLFSAFLVMGKKINNSLLYTIGTLLLQSLILLIYGLYAPQSRYRQLLLWSIPLMFLLAGWNLFYGQGLEILNTHTFGLFSLWVALHSYWLIRQEILHKGLVLDNPIIGLATGNFVYYTLGTNMVLIMQSLPQYSSITVKLNQLAYCIQILIILSSFLWTSARKTSSL